jgi:hypothetical protein
LLKRILLDEKSVVHHKQLDVCSVPLWEPVEGFDLQPLHLEPTAPRTGEVRAKSQR